MEWRKRYLSDPRGGSTVALECPDCHALVFKDEWYVRDGETAKDRHAEWHLRLQNATGVLHK